MQTKPHFYASKQQNKQAMEVVVPRSPKSPEFNFSRSSAPSPYASAPSSPKAFGNPDEYYYCCTSAPASPSRAAAVYSYFAGDHMDDWQEKPAAPKSQGSEFGFPLGAGVQDVRSTADELFDRGHIKTMKPPNSPTPSSLSNRTPISSPSTSTASASAAAPFAKSSGSKKWRFKDLLLFRNASEGRATGRGSKDPLCKYTLLSVSFNKRRPSEDAKSSGSFTKRSSPGPAVSAHELHYTASRAAAEEQKKKTPLPYHRNTLFGCLHFNPVVRHITRGFNSNSFNRSRP